MEHQHDDAPGSGLDPDLLLINEWLAGDLTPSQLHAVEQRLDDDQAFFERVLPHVRVWTSPPPLRHPPS